MLEPPALQHSVVLSPASVGGLGSLVMESLTVESEVRWPNSGGIRWFFPALWHLSTDMGWGAIDSVDAHMRCRPAVSEAPS